MLLDLFAAADAADAAADDGLGTKCVLPTGGVEGAGGTVATIRRPVAGRLDEGAAVAVLRRGDAVFGCEALAEMPSAAFSPSADAACLVPALRPARAPELKPPEDSISSTARAKPSL